MLNTISKTEHSDFIESPPKAITENIVVLYFSDGAEKPVSKKLAPYLPSVRAVVRYSEAWKCSEIHTYRLTMLPIAI